jgi:hypothetical protein
MQKDEIFHLDSCGKDGKYVNQFKIATYTATPKS